MHWPEVKSRSRSPPDQRSKVRKSHGTQEIVIGDWEAPVNTMLHIGRDDFDVMDVVRLDGDVRAEFR
jgi:hypothetical protein